MEQRSRSVAERPVERRSLLNLKAVPSERQLSPKERLVQAVLLGKRGAPVWAALCDSNALNPDFPKGGNTLFLSRLLLNCGVDVGYHPNPGAMMGKLLQVGCYFFPRGTAPPQVGDIYAGVNEGWAVVHLGFVSRIKVGAGEFWSIDELVEDYDREAYRRPEVGSDSFYDVGYWIRLPG